MRRTSKRHQHRGIPVVLLALLAWGLCSSPVLAQTTPLGLEAPVERFYCEEVLEVSLMIGPVVDLQGISVELGFDPAVLAVLEVLPGALLDNASCGHFLNWLNPTPGEDHLAIDVGLLGCSTSGSGELLRLRFVGLANGTSPLTLDTGLLRNSLNQPIAFSPVDDSVDYRCPRPGTVRFVPPDASFGCRQTLEVEIHIDEYTLDLRGSSLEIDFDENVVEPIAIVAGSLVTGAACPFYLNWLNPGPGATTIQVDVANLGCSVDGPGAILKITFQGVNQGLSPLECISLILRDGDNHDIEADCVPASIEYRCPVGVEESAWGMLKARFRE